MFSQQGVRIMKELNVLDLNAVAGGCDECLSSQVTGVSNNCQVIFTTFTKPDTNLPPALGVLLMLQYCTGNEVKFLIEDYKVKQALITPSP